MLYSTVFEDESAKLIQKFVKWGYKAGIIKEKVKQASNMSREILLQETQHNNNVSCRPLTICYSNTGLFWR